MTKELELFKKWFGIDPTFGRPSIMVQDKGAYLSFPINLGLKLNKGIMKELKYNEDFFREIFIRTSPFRLECLFIYNIPPEHQAEYEDYIKQQKEKQG